MRQMKDSGVEWIGVIPENWDVKRVKNAFVRKKEEAHQNDPVVLSLARAGVKVRDISSGEGQIAESYYNYNPVDIGDFLLNPMDLYSGANCSISKVQGVISPAYINLRARSEFDAAYYDYYFKTQYWAMAMFAHGKGVSFDNRWTLNANDLLNYFIPVPCYEEQQSISAYLDYQCAHIDNIIEKTKASIEEYKKLRQAVITQAVTRGVRGNRVMKDSGVEWIGMIPEEWKKTKLGRISSLRSGITLGRKIPDDAKMIERPYLRVANVQNGYVDISTVTTLEVTEEEDGKYRLHKDDVLMTEGGDRDKLGRGCVWNGEIEPCLHQNHIFALKTDPKYLNQYYFAYVTASQIGRVYFDITAIKTTNLACTSSSKVMAFIFPLPSIEEQQEIAAYLDQKCAEIDSLINKKDQFLTEIEAYKRSMIYEYVTGKKEVPHS